MSRFGNRCTHSHLRLIPAGVKTIHCVWAQLKPAYSARLPDAPQPSFSRHAFFCAFVEFNRDGFQQSFDHGIRSGALAGGGGLWLLAWAYRRIRGEDGLGLGDAKLMLLVGALLGPVAVPLTLFTGAVLALPFGIMAVNGEDGNGLKTTLPFGPFLCAGAAAFLLIGPQFLRWWLGPALP